MNTTPVIAPVLISAYAASPAYARWDPVLEGDLLRALCALPAVAGLEVPWLGALHPHDPVWFLDNVPTGTRLAFTALPWVMRRCSAQPGYGLASPDAGGRAAAVADLRMLHGDARIVAERSGARVSLVGIHTAPRGGGDVDALARSLDEVAAWDWSGARLTIEHCDTVRPGQQFEKGFLALDDEIAAIERASVPIGLWMNWGRSAIELRDPDAVTAQIARASDTGRLDGLTFSGATSEDGPYGAAWADTHTPIRSTDPSSLSLLNDVQVAAALTAAGDLPWLGLKVSRRPSDTTAAEIAATVSRNLHVIHRAIGDARG